MLSRGTLKKSAQPKISFIVDLMKVKIMLCKSVSDAILESSIGKKNLNGDQETIPIFSRVLRDSIGHYVGRSVRRSVRRSVGNQFAFLSFFDSFEGHYCPCPHTRLMLPCIRPCNLFTTPRFCNFAIIAQICK